MSRRREDTIGGNLGKLTQICLALPEVACRRWVDPVDRASREPQRSDLSAHAGARTED